MYWSRQSFFASFVDLGLVGVSWWLAFWLRFNLDIPDEFQALMLQALPWPLLVYGVSLAGWRVYRHIWRYTSLAEVTRLFFGVAIGGLVTAAAVLMLRVPSFPRSVLLLHPMLALLALGGVRAMVRLLQKDVEPDRGAAKSLLLVGTVQDAAARGTMAVSPIIPMSSPYLPVSISSWATTATTARIRALVRPSAAWVSSPLNS